MHFSTFFTTISFKSERIEFRLGMHIVSAWKSLCLNSKYIEVENLILLKY